MSTRSNYYTILGINYTANIKAIKTAYRSKAKQYHPDKNPGNKAAEDQFKLIQEAYYTLSNSAKRYQYDIAFGGVQQTIYQPEQFSGKGYPFTHGMKQPKPQPTATEEVEKPIPSADVNYIFISFFVAIILLYFVISYQL
jgi:curved DNA-binding protein CbpA